MGDRRPAPGQLSARPEALSVEHDDLVAIAQPSGSDVVLLFPSKKNFVLFGRGPVRRQLRHEHARRAREEVLTHSKKSMPTRTTRFPSENEADESRLSKAILPTLLFSRRAGRSTREQRTQEPGSDDPQS